MKHKLGRPPLIQIDFNEVNKYNSNSSSNNNNHQASFSAIMNLQKDGVFVTSPTPNFISPSNKQHQQSNQTEKQVFSQYNQQYMAQQNDIQTDNTNSFQDYNSGSTQEKFYSYDSQQRQSLSSQQQTHQQYHQQQQLLKQTEQQLQTNSSNSNKENTTKRNSCSPNMVDNYYQRIKQFNDFAKLKKFQSYVNRGSYDFHPNSNEYNQMFQEHQQHGQYNTDRDVSPQIRGSQGQLSGGELSNQRLKSIAQTNKSLVRNSSSSNITIQPQRISVDMSEFMVKKPPQPPSNRTPSGRDQQGLRQSTPHNLNNLYHNFNEGQNMLNLTPKAQYIKTSSSKSPSHKKTKSLMDFIKNGISNSTKNLNRPLNETGRLSQQKVKSSQINQQQNPSKRMREGNFNSVGRKDSQKHLKGNQSLSNIKMNANNPCTNRSGASTTAHTIVSPLVSPNLIVQPSQSLNDSKNLDKSFTRHPQSTKAFIANNNYMSQNNLKFPSSTKNSITQNGQINENGILFKNQTKSISIKQKVLSDRKKQRQNKNESRYATEADQIHEEEDEGIYEENRMNKINSDNKEELLNKSYEQIKENIQLNTEDKTSLSYRQMMINQAQIGKEHPTPSQIKFLQSNQKNKYFEKCGQEDQSCIIDRQDTECTNRTQLQTQNTIQQPQSQFSPIKNQPNIVIQNFGQENLDESFQEQHNCHSIHKVQSQLGINGLTQSKDYSSIGGLNSLPFTLNSTKNNSNYQTSFPLAINVTLPSSIENDSILQRNNFFSTTNNNQFGIQSKQLNPLIQDQYQQQSDSSKHKLNESMVTSSEKHLREKYPIFPENSDQKEMGTEQKNSTESQYEMLYKNKNQQNSFIPIPNISKYYLNSNRFSLFTLSFNKLDSQYTENYLIPSSSNRILQQLQNLQSNQTLQIKKVESQYQNNDQKITSSNNMNSHGLEGEQSVMMFQNSQEVNLNEKILNQPQQKQQQFTTRFANQDINELSFEAKNIDNSQRNLSSIETNTLNSFQNLNYLNILSNISHNNLSSSYNYNQGLNTPKQNQTKQSANRIINGINFPISSQIVQQEPLVQQVNSRNTSPTSNQQGRANIHKLSPTSNAKLNKLIEIRSLSQEKVLPTIQNLTYQQQPQQLSFPFSQNQQTQSSYIAENVLSSLQSTPYQNYSNNQFSQFNTLEKQNSNSTANNVISNPHNNNSNNLFQESFSQFNNQQTSVGTDRQATNLISSPKQQASHIQLHQFTSDCSSYRVDPMYQQQINQYTHQKSSIQAIPENIDLQRMNTDQSMFESYPYQPHLNGQSNNIRTEECRQSLPQTTQLNQNCLNTNTTQQIGSQLYQNKFFHPIDVNGEQKENNSHFTNNYGENSQQNQAEKQDRQLESQYLIQRLQQVQKEQQQQQQQSQYKRLNSEVDMSKLDRSYITTTEELGAELQENKVSTLKLLQHVSYLENRIRKLVNEDENLDNRIQNINMRREDMSIIKMRNQEDNQRLKNLKQRQQDQIKEMKRKISQGRIQSRERLEKSKMQSQMHKKQIANSVKETSMINKSLLDETKSQEALRQSFIINNIKTLERRLVEEKSNKATNALQQSKINQMTKIEQEQENQQQLQSKIQELEQIEQQLIESLEQKYEKNKSLLYI